jgi:hypothetical protein
MVPELGDDLKVKLNKTKKICKGVKNGEKQEYL